MTYAVTCSVDDIRCHMQAYVHELGQCLLTLDDDKAGQVENQMLTLCTEGMRLIGRRLLQNPAAHKVLITSSLAQGQRTLLHLDTAFYSNLLVSRDALWHACVRTFNTHANVNCFSCHLPCLVPALPCPACLALHRQLLYYLLLTTTSCPTGTVMSPPRWFMINHEHEPCLTRLQHLDDHAGAFGLTRRPDC